MTFDARLALARAIRDIDFAVAVLPLLTPADDATRIRARLKATSAELAVLRARLSDAAPISRGWLNTT